MPPIVWLCFFWKPGILKCIAAIYRTILEYSYYIPVKPSGYLALPQYHKFILASPPVVAHKCCRVSRAHIELNVNQESQVKDTWCRISLAENACSQYVHLWEELCAGLTRILHLFQPESAIVVVGQQRFEAPASLIFALWSGDGPCGWIVER